MLIKSNACVIMFLSNQCFIKPCMFELVLQRFEKLDSRSICQVLEQKDWKLSLEIKSNEYISVLPFIFQFHLNLPFSYKALINSTCNSGLYRTYKQQLDTNGNQILTWFLDTECHFINTTNNYIQTLRTKTSDLKQGKRLFNR